VKTTYCEITDTHQQSHSTCSPIHTEMGA